MMPVSAPEYLRVTPAPTVVTENTYNKLFGNVYPISASATMLGGPSSISKVSELKPLRYDLSGKNQKPSWLVKCSRKLEEMYKLLPNWNGMGSDPPNITAINTAKNVLDILHEINLPPSKIMASVEEGVAISFVKSNKYGMVECYNDGGVIILFPEGAGEPEIIEVGPSSLEIKDALVRMRSYV
ncbi:MAG: hypothetical protein HQK58_09915 [Deltaproteobacteria bacterium]|nr:hypothetical protein [Deltaproteobacteria bacterium]